MNEWTSRPSCSLLGIGGTHGSKTGRPLAFQVVAGWGFATQHYTVPKGNEILYPSF